MRLKAWAVKSGMVLRSRNRDMPTPERMRTELLIFWTLGKFRKAD